MRTTTFLTAHFEKVVGSNGSSDFKVTGWSHPGSKFAPGYLENKRAVIDALFDTMVKLDND